MKIQLKKGKDCIDIYLKEMDQIIRFIFPSLWDNRYAVSVNLTMRIEFESRRDAKLFLKEVIRIYLEEKL